MSCTPKMPNDSDETEAEILLHLVIPVRFVNPDVLCCTWLLSVVSGDEGDQK